MATHNIYFGEERREIFLCEALQMATHNIYFGEERRETFLCKVF